MLLSMYFMLLFLCFLFLQLVPVGPLCIFLHNSSKYLTFITTCPCPRFENVPHLESELLDSTQLTAIRSFWLLYWAVITQTNLYLLFQVCVFVQTGIRLLCLALDTVYFSPPL